MIRRILAVLFSLGMLHIASANSPADYAYVFPIDTATNADTSAWRVELTPEVYRWVQDGALRDIEIFNAAQQPVPFARIAVEAAATEREYSATLPALALPATATTSASDLRLVIDRDADGRLRRIDAGEQSSAKTSTRDWLLDASGMDRAIDSLLVSWSEPVSGVVARFAIESSDDLQTWRNAGTATVLVLEQQGAHLERRDITLGGVRAKYLRLHRLDDGAELVGLRASARSVERGRATPVRTWLTADPLRASDAGDPVAPGVTRLGYLLPSALPVDTARVELVTDNALAPITLLARATETSSQWNRVAQLTAFRLRQGDETIRNGDIDVRMPGRLREFRIESPTTIAQAPRLSFAYRPDSFVFLAEGEGPYVLAAGSARAKHAEYPLDAALASLRAKFGKDWQPPVATLGHAQSSGGDAVLRPAPPPLPWRRWVLWAVLVGGALLVAGFALTLLRGTTKPDP
jgi:hypothetical protein